MSCSVGYIWVMNEFKANIMYEPIELIKFLCLFMMTKNIYLEMDTIDYHILISELVNHTKIISSSIDNLFSYSV